MICIRHLLSLFGILFTAVSVAAAKPDLRPVFEDRFDRAELGDEWRPGKGIWRLENGVLFGGQEGGRGHAAVLIRQQPCTDSVIRFRFKFERTHSIAISYEAKSGHLMRITVTPEGMSIGMTKAKGAPESKTFTPVETKGTISVGEWHTLEATINGPNAAARIDRQLSVSASHPGIAVPKHAFRLLVRGFSVRFDDIQVQATGP